MNARRKPYVEVHRSITYTSGKKDPELTTCLALPLARDLLHAEQQENPANDDESFGAVRPAKNVRSAKSAWHHQPAD